MAKEIWRNIYGFTGYYQVSNLGRVKRVNGKILKAGTNEWGYKYVILFKKGNSSPKRVSRLVAKAFIPNPKNLPEVNHKKGKKEDNRSSQLEWSTVSHNRKEAWRLGLNKGNTKFFK